MSDADTDRIKGVYRGLNAREGYADDYSPLNPARLFEQQVLDRVLQRAFLRAGFRDFADKHILDVGCGTGALLEKLRNYGARPENLAGIDLLEERIKQAHSRYPSVSLAVGNAESLPYEDRSFDLVSIFYVLSSVHDDRIRTNIACECLRVLRWTGAILYADIRYTKPGSSGYYNAIGLKKRDIQSLFPDCFIDLASAVLYRGLTKMLVGYSWTLCEILHKVPLLRVSYLGLIRRRG